jgi:hypothetical protein
MDEYELPPIPTIKLGNPTEVLHVAMEKSRDQRVHYRAKHIPMEDLFSQEELEDLENQFQLGVGVNNESQTITMVYLMAILNQMNFELEGRRSFPLNRQTRSWRPTSKRSTRSATRRRSTSSSSRASWRSSSRS